MPRFNYDHAFIPVSRDFIENKMPDANGSYVKVYLTSLCLAATSAEMDTAEIASRLNLLESDVINALNYWQDADVLSYDGDSVTFKSSSSLGSENGYTQQNNIDNTEVKASSSDGDYPKKKSIQQIAEEMTKNQALADLCVIAQEILGKTLKNNEIETLYWFYDDLGLSPEVITMLLEYCVSKDKRSMGYIEKTAMSWHKNGIITIDAADRFISEEKDKNGYIYTLKKLFGFENRNFTKSEEVYMTTWRDSYGMDENMVGLAYEYCVMQINKISFPYMDSIMKRWNDMGIHTIEAAEKEHEDFKSKSKPADLNVYDDSDVDYEKIEQIMREKM